MTDETTVPRQVLERVAAGYHELVALKVRQAATQAELIRGCVAELRSDPNTYRLRGHETYSEAARIRQENRENKALALLYLEWLATNLEREAGVDLGAPAVTISKP